MIGTLLGSHAKPRREDFFKKKLSLLYNFSATAAISPISFHKSKSPESPYRAVVEVPPLTTRGVTVDHPGELVLLDPCRTLCYITKIKYF